MFSKIALALLALTLLAACGQGEFKPAPVAETVESLTIDPHEVERVSPKAKTSTSYEALLADRRYIHSVFSDVFGPRSASVDSTRSHLNALDHGSPCSVYVDHLIADGSGLKRADATETCSRLSLARTVAAINPKPTVTRQTLLTKACSDLVSDNRTLTHALKKISSAAVPASTPANMKKAFRLFYRLGREPHAGLVESLLIMVPTEGATVEHWRSVINSVCASGVWSIL